MVFGRPKLLDLLFEPYGQTVCVWGAVLAGAGHKVARAGVEEYDLAAGLVPS